MRIFQETGLETWVFNTFFTSVVNRDLRILFIEVYISWRKILTIMYNNIKENRKKTFMWRLNKLRRNRFWNVHSSTSVDGISASITSNQRHPLPPVSKRPLAITRKWNIHLVPNSTDCHSDIEARTLRGGLHYTTYPRVRLWINRFNTGQKSILMWEIIKYYLFVYICIYLILMLKGIKNFKNIIFFFCFNQ